ncbi:sugar ABC transporter substrate-binding protein [Blastococcus litoris]|uniref:sugar ABC transporter substrate-binding protein n=1 Tax=Blastococcus litoris TaxID=2171622 RepID=UPI000E304917|nr:substrate-binding domain-containing protein [Blastococcus litoris]
MRVTGVGPRRRWATSVVAASAALALTACSSESTAGSGSDGEPVNEEAAQVVQEAQERIEARLAGETYEEPPSEGPAAVSGARVAMVNVGTQAPTGAYVAENAEEIAGIMGWELSIYDGEFNPTKFQEGIRQAIAAQADVIWLFAVDCPVARTALEEAKAAGIPVISQEGADCSDVEDGAPSLFTHNLEFADGDFIEWGRALGAAQADYLIAETGGNARVIEISVPDLYVTAALHEGFVERMEECSTCEILQTIENSAAALGPELQAKIEQALLRNPDANGLAVSYDDLMTAGGAAAVMASGRSDDLAVVAGTGFEPNIELVRNDQGQDAGYGIDYGYETWAGADLVNRFLAGAEIGPSGDSLGFYDRDNLPGSGSYTSPIDYRPAYTEVWQG